ncbi:MAG: hypothetical protein GF333_00930 [Candidatus Omnitrophica bacterium]|nr:hypothetical protein [Candidatus Omnitrophota bacterium]
MESKYPIYGIDAFRNLSWGSHICHFYHSTDELLEIVLPFLEAGLEQNQFCVWVIPETLSPLKAQELLAREIPGVEEFLKKRALAILQEEEVYSVRGPDRAQKIIELWLQRFNDGLRRGFTGMRVAGHCPYNAPLESIRRYEREVDRVIGKYKIIAVCAYAVERFSVAQAIEAGCLHEKSFMKKRGDWESIPRATYAAVKDRL